MVPLLISVVFFLGPASAQSGSVSLSLEPSTAILAKNDVIALSIIIDATVQPTDAAQVYLNFDPDLLKVVDAMGDPASSIEFGPEISDLWPVKLSNQADNATGRIVVAAAKGLPGLGGAAANQQIVLAIVRFKTLQAVDNTDISFDMEANLDLGNSQFAERSIILAQGVEVTGPYTGATISVTAAADPSPSPTSPPETPGPPEVQLVDQSGPPQAAESPGNGFPSVMLRLGIGLSIGLVLVAIFGGVVLTNVRLKRLILRRG